LWLAYAVGGVEARAGGDGATATRLWRTGLALCDHFPADDPRRAASLVQLGLGAPDAASAAELFTRAEAAWCETRATWLARLPAGGRARSSTFHLRLGRKHPGGYDHLAQAAHERLCEAGRAAALGNLAGALIALGRHDEAAARLDQALVLRRAGFGHREAGVGSLLRLGADLARFKADGDGAMRLEDAARAIAADPVVYDVVRLRRETGRRYDDLWRLRAAIYLSPIEATAALRPAAPGA